MAGKVVVELRSLGESHTSGGEARLDLQGRGWSPEGETVVHRLKLAIYGANAWLEPDS